MEGAQRRLTQRRQALFPWLDENTYIVTPDRTFEDGIDFEVGDIHFSVKHLGPAKLADQIMDSA